MWTQRSSLGKFGSPMIAGKISIPNLFIILTERIAAEEYGVWDFYVLSFLMLVSLDYFQWLIVTVVHFLRSWIRYVASRRLKHNPLGNVIPWHYDCLSVSISLKCEPHLNITSARWNYDVHTRFQGHICGGENWHFLFLLPFMRFSRGIGGLVVPVHDYLVVLWKLLRHLVLCDLLDWNFCDMQV